MADNRPILYSFRRCPYAMRARMALIISGQSVILREVKLPNKPAAMIAASAKATVPVLVLHDGQVLEESLTIMRWALAQHDPENWQNNEHSAATAELIAQCDGPFKHDLDRYKYHTRYAHENAGAGVDPLTHRAAGLAFLETLQRQLASHNLPPEQSQLFGAGRSFADIAIFPFIRQFANHDRAWFDALPLPHVHGWLSTHVNSPLFTAAMQKEQPWQDNDTPITFPKAMK
ncbi:glutathione S-transferase [Parasphingorhabdus sp. DH2-15]|uniref:glutathione S-transferase n=1 Tax=Parasphingorhabdus sp. DH2-15 TaxID=3444112 RepID=UPI003F6825BA